MVRARVFAMAACAAVLSAGAAFGESVWVQSESVQLRSGKGAVYPLVGTAPKGTELNVLAREGVWVQVQAGQATGWITDSSLSAKKVGTGLNLGTAPRFAAMDTSAAGRQLMDGAVKYAANKGIDPAPLQRLEQINRGIAPQEWEAFSKAIAQPAAPGTPTPVMPTPAPAVR